MNNKYLFNSTVLVEPTNVFFLDHTGRFEPCGLHTRSKKIFSNLLKESLEDIVKKDIFKEYHKYWLNRNYCDKQPEICKNCYLMRAPYFTYCLDEGYLITENFRKLRKRII